MSAGLETITKPGQTLVKRPPPMPQWPPFWTRRELVTAMGLAYDPFLAEVSENDPAGSFADIFVDPSPSLLEQLHRPHPTLVVADYGMGKSATRLAFEYWLRTNGSRPVQLCVTYTPRVQDAASLGQAALREHHYRGLAEATAIDLVIQLLERIDEIPAEFSEQQYAALARQAAALPPRFKQRIRSAASVTPASGAIWGGTSPLSGIRPTVRYVATTPRWAALVKWLAEHMTPQMVPQSWAQTLADARSLGFEQTFLLVDAIDEGEPDPLAQHWLIAPLLADAADLAEQQHCFLKCFVPPGDLVDNYDRTVAGHSLTGSIEIARIDRATPQDLIAIVHERLQAASMPSAAFLSIDVFARGDIVESIEERLALLADGSPRRMMRLVSGFLDFCASLRPENGERRERPYIRRQEWERFLVEAGPGPGLP